MKKYCIVVITFLFSSTLIAQEPGTEYKKHEFGAHAGATTGLGLSYRHWFNKLGIQATAIPIKTDNTFVTSIGATGLYSLKRVRNTHAFLYLGNHFIYGRDNTDVYNVNTGLYEPITTTDMFYNIGFGPGFSFGHTVNFTIMIGYGIYDVTNNFNIWPTGEIGVYYMF